MTTLGTILVLFTALALALLLAFVPLRVLMASIERNMAAPIRAFIQRQRERRRALRSSPDRRGPAS